jgi:hypothetical protein
MRKSKRRVVNRGPKPEKIPKKIFYKIPRKVTIYSPYTMGTIKEVINKAVAFVKKDYNMNVPKDELVQILEDLKVLLILYAHQNDHHLADDLRAELHALARKTLLEKLPNKNKTQALINREKMIAEMNKNLELSNSQDV